MKDDIVYTHSDDPLQVDIEHLQGLEQEREQEYRSEKDIEREKQLGKEVADFCERIERKCFTNRCPLRSTSCVNAVSFSQFYKRQSPVKKKSIDAIIENEVRHYDEIIAEYNAKKSEKKKQTQQRKVLPRWQRF